MLTALIFLFLMGKMVSAGQFQHFPELDHPGSVLPLPTSAGVRPTGRPGLSGSLGRDKQVEAMLALVTLETPEIGSKRGKMKRVSQYSVTVGRDVKNDISNSKLEEKKIQRSLVTPSSRLQSPTTRGLYRLRRLETRRREEEVDYNSLETPVVLPTPLVRNISFTGISEEDNWGEKLIKEGEKKVLPQRPIKVTFRKKGWKNLGESKGNEKIIWGRRLRGRKVEKGRKYNGGNEIVRGNDEERRRKGVRGIKRGRKRSKEQMNNQRQLKEGERYKMEDSNTPVSHRYRQNIPTTGSIRQPTNTRTLLRARTKKQRLRL